MARQAVAIDTSFAAGWSLLAAEMRDAEMPRARLRVDQGRMHDAASIAAVGHRRFPDNTTMAVFAIEVLYHLGQRASFEHAVDSVRLSRDDRIVDWGQVMGGAVALLHGRAGDWRRLTAEYGRQLARQGVVHPALADSAQLINVEAQLYGPSAALAERLDHALTPVARRAGGRPRVFRGGRHVGRGGPSGPCACFSRRLPR